MTERALRKHARRKIDVLVRLKILDKEIECPARELSEGGLFVIMDNPLEIGTKTNLILKVGSDSLKLEGEVVFSITKKKADAQSREPGIGIRFINLGSDLKNKINSLIF